MERIADHRLHEKMERLRRLVAVDERPQALPPAGAPPSASAFVTRRTERIAETRFERAALVLVIEGAKELVQGGRTVRVEAGTAVTLAAGWRGTVVNEPALGSGFYRALYVDFPPALILSAHRAHPNWPAAGMSVSGRGGLVSLTPPLVASVLHLCEALAPERLAPHLVEHRAMEVLLVLVDQGALPIGPQGRAGPLAESVCALLRWRPAHRWTADEIGRELGLANATLRRRLAAEGTSFRTLLAAERMDHARTLMMYEGSTIAEAAHASGYGSRSRFSRRYKQVFGASPSSIRANNERNGHNRDRNGHEKK